MSFFWVLFFGLIYILLSSCSRKQIRIVPEKRNLIEAVYSSVIVQPDSLYEVYAIVSGILDNNFVEEGEIVLKNEAILQIINTTPKLNTQNAKLSLELARENYTGSETILKGVRDEIIAATLKYKNDSTNFFRQKELWNQKIGSNIEFDAKKLKFQLSKNNLQLLKSKYFRIENELKTAVKQAENNYKTSLIFTKDFTVKSKISGRVYALYKKHGEIVSTMESLAAIGSSNNFIIEMLVDEVDIVKILIGQNVIVSLDAYGGKVFKGKVSKIYPKKDERSQTFKVEAVFDEPPNVLYPGLSGEANIIINSKENVLTLPKEYLIEGNKINTSNGIIEVEVGIQNLEHIEILSGITETTFILKPE